MATHPITIDISNKPDLVRLVEEVKNAKQPRILEKNKKPVAMLMPMEPAGKQREKRQVARHTIKHSLQQQEASRGSLMRRD